MGFQQWSVKNESSTWTVVVGVWDSAADDNGLVLVEVSACCPKMDAS